MPETKPLETQPIPKLFPKMALPCVIAMVANAGANLLQTVFAVPLGEQAVATLGIVFSALTLFQAVGYTVALGGCTLFSPALARGTREEIHSIGAATVWLDLTAGCVLGCLAFLFARPLVIFLGADPPLVSFCLAYGKPLFLSAPFLCGNYALSGLLRCVGKSTAAMVGLMVGTGVTVGLTPLFFYEFSTGIGGAGWAFFIGQGVSLGILWMFIGKTEEVSLHFPKNHWKLFLQIPYYGISSLVRQGFYSVSFIALNRLASKYGTGVVAAVSLGNRITGLCYNALLGWGQGFAPIGGYAFGKNDEKRLKDALSYGCKTAVWGMTVLGIGIILFSLTTNPYTKLLTLTQGITLPLLPLGVFATYGYQTTKRPLTATVISCLRQGICFLPTVYFLSRFWGVTGILIAQGISDILTFLLCFVPYRRLRKV